MLTGMGSDGLEGTRAVVDHGGAAVVQDEATSVVWGMPGAVARAGLAHAVLPLTQIGASHPGPCWDSAHEQNLPGAGRCAA